jgi:hypothetical protein
MRGYSYFVNVLSDEVSPFDAATTAWVAAVVSNGGTVSGGRQIAVNDLIVGLKADGIWTKLDRLWLFAAENTASALTDLAANELATEVNSPTFTVDSGYSNGGSGVYIDTNFNPVTAAGNYVRDDASWFLWNVTSRAANAVYDWGAAGVTNQDNFLRSRDSGDVVKFAINLILGAIPSFANTDSGGFYQASRTGPTASEFYKNGVSLGTDSGSSAVLVSVNFFVQLLNNNGAPHDGSSDEYSCFGAGSSLTPTESADLYSHLRTYMTAVGVP